MSIKKILLTEAIHPCAQQALVSEGFAVDLIAEALSSEKLIEALANYDALGIRSKTQVHGISSETWVSKRCQVVGAFCIGTNQIDLNSTNAAGVPVFNAPYSNTRSVAELVIAEMVCLSRRLADVSRLAHQGVWQKSASGAHEVRGKILGIIGYGHIGSQVSVLAEAMGMKVLYFDILKKLPMGNAQPVQDLSELLLASDFVTLHVPETPQTQWMMGAEQMAQMKQGSYLINASRGQVVVIEALKAALQSGRVAGAAVDVFPQEPSHNKEAFTSDLQGLSNVILTPHIGGSTEEAQEAIGREVAESLTRFFKEGATIGAVNFPMLAPPPIRESVRITNIHRNVPGVLGKINGIVSSKGANIQGQYLATDPVIGYLIMDLQGGDAQRVAAEIENLETSLRTRALKP